MRKTGRLCATLGLALLVLAALSAMVFGAETHKVTFYKDAARSAVLDTQQVADGEHPTKPAKTPKDYEAEGFHYKFDGWYWMVGGNAIPFSFTNEDCEIWSDAAIYAGYTQYLAEGYVLIIVHSKGSEFIEDTTTPMSDILKQYSGITRTDVRPKSDFVSGSGDPNHKHSMTYHVAVVEGCTTDGNREYWSCSTCGKYYGDAEGKYEIVKDSWVIPAHHVFDQAVASEDYLVSVATCTSPAVYYKSCACGAAGTETFSYGDCDLENHDWNNIWQENQPSTCISSGQEYDTCKRDPTHIRYQNKAFSGHSLSKTDAVAATCTTNGNIDYWTCGNCDQYFGNALGTYEVTQGSWVIPASHKLVAHPAVAPTTTSGGNSAYWECAVCHKYFSDAKGKNEIKKGSWVKAKLKPAPPKEKVDRPSVKISKPKAGKKSMTVKWKKVSKKNQGKIDRIEIQITGPSNFKKTVTVK